MVGQGNDSEWRHWLCEADATGVDSTQGRFFTLANMALEAALAHRGVALGRASLIAELLASGRLITPIDKPVRSPVGYCLVCPKELMSRPAIRIVIDWLQEKRADHREGARWHRTRSNPSIPTSLEIKTTALHSRPERAMVTCMSEALDSWFKREVVVHEKALTRYLYRSWPHPDESPRLAPGNLRPGV